MNYRFKFDIAPIPKGRPRFSTRGGFARTYTPEKTASFEKTVALMAARQLAGRPKLQGPLVAVIVFEFKKPKKTKLPHPRPDIDNLQKSFLDSLNEIVFDDDSQVWEVHATKTWADQDSIFITIEEQANVGGISGTA